MKGILAQHDDMIAAVQESLMAIVDLPAGGSDVRYRRLRGAIRKVAKIKFHSSRWAK